MASRILLEDHKDTLDADAQGISAWFARAPFAWAALIDDILAFSRVLRTGMSMARVNMTALAEEVFAELQAGAKGRNIRFILGEPAAGAWRCRHDPAGTGQSPWECRQIHALAA